MLQVVWKFQIKSGAAPEFERHYGPGGTWAMLFRRSPAYQGTILLRDRSNPLRYLTIDTWDDLKSFETFKKSVRQEYEALDQACESLTEREECLGWFDGLA